MVRATEKEIMKLVTNINEYRLRVGKHPFLLGKSVLARKLQNRNMYQLKYLKLKEDGSGVVHQYTPFISGKLLLNFLSGLLEGVHIGMKLALITEINELKEDSK